MSMVTSKRGQSAKKTRERAMQARDQQLMTPGKSGDGKDAKNLEQTQNTMNQTKNLLQKRQKKPAYM